MATHVPVWIVWLQGLSVPLVTALGAWIAYQQMKIARSKLKHELWDKRFGVYETTISIIEAGKQRRLTKELLDVSFKNTAGSWFLFDANAATKIRAVFSYAEEAMGMNLTTYNDKSAEEQLYWRNRQIEEAYVELERLRQEINEAFRPFLKLDRLT